MPKLRKPNMNEYRIKKAKLDICKERLEQKNLIKKVLSMYRKMINEKYERLLEIRAKEYSQYKIQIKVLVITIKLLQISQFELNKFYVRT